MKDWKHGRNRTIMKHIRQFNESNNIDELYQMFQLLDHNGHNYYRAYIGEYDNDGYDEIYIEFDDVIEMNADQALGSMKPMNMSLKEYIKSNDKEVKVINLLISEKQREFIYNVSENRLCEDYTKILNDTLIYLGYEDLIESDELGLI